MLVYLFDCLFACLFVLEDSFALVQLALEFVTRESFASSFSIVFRIVLSNAFSFVFSIVFSVAFRIALRIAVKQETRETLTCDSFVLVQLTLGIVTCDRFALSQTSKHVFALSILP